MMQQLRPYLNFFSGLEYEPTAVCEAILRSSTREAKRRGEEMFDSKYALALDGM